jgi:hypothetical protein
MFKCKCRGTEERNQKIIAEMHNCPIGHQGIQRTIERIKLLPIVARDRPRRDTIHKRM